MTEKELLRKEHNKRVSNGEYKRVLGCECVNCGSTEMIEYHHIVPICQGGTNKMSNIVPVCNRCHKAIHGEKDYRAYKLSQRSIKSLTGNNQGIYDSDIQKYIKCKITKEALVEILGVKSTLKNNKYYRNYLNSHGIKTVVNRVDAMIENLEYPPPLNTEIGYIVYKSGKVENIYYTDTTN